ncbi:MAG: hypothetical protein M1835_004112 [Candelina submexicana]|nr:MAG: hypothetical protein M1835_004112 [Candelina submexicana]
MGNGFEDESFSPPPSLFERLSKIPGYTWDESIAPFHSSYDNWHVFGIRHILPSTNPSPPETTRSSSTRTSPRPETSRASLSQYASSVSDNGSEYSSAKQEPEKTYQNVIARISTHTLRLEREYHLCQSLIQTSDPECRHIVRSVEFRRLPSQQGDDGVPIAVSIVESPGRNWLRGLVSFGPAFYGGPKPPQVPGAHSRGYMMEDPISLPEFLDFAIGASECLELLHHGAQIVHGEIRGDAFHFNRETGLVKLINFGSGLRSFENGLTSVGWSTLTKEIGVKNKLQFIAPEQTGRMAAEPDSRTDIYSLGVLFWIMLTRQPAFEGPTPMDILQGVLGKRIPSASSIRLDIPDILSSILQKMTQKHIDERYHSVSGLKHDFTELQKILGNGDGEALKAFKIGSRDVSSFFVLPSTMIGRQKEYGSIVKVIDKVSRLHQSTGVAAKRGIYSMSSNSSMSEAQYETMHDGSSDGGSLHEAETSRQNSSIGPAFLGDTPETYKDSEDTQVSVASDSTKHRSPLESKSSLASKNSLDTGASGDSLVGDRSVTGSGGHHDGAGSLVKRANSQKFHRNGRCEVICISGAAGLGKSTLVQSVQVEARRHGYFASSKFDQAKKCPFEPVLKVMSSVGEHLMTFAAVD